MRNASSSQLSQNSPRQANSITALAKKSSLANCYSYKQLLELENQRNFHTYIRFVDYGKLGSDSSDSQIERDSLRLLQQNIENSMRELNKFGPRLRSLIEKFGDFRVQLIKMQLW